MWDRSDYTSGTSQWLMTLWDIAPDKTIPYSPQYLFTDWIPDAMASSSLNGEDGLVRIMFQHIPSHAYAIVTINPADWSITNVAYL